MLKSKVAREVAKVAKHRAPAGYLWLVRHMERQNGRCAYCGILMFPPRDHPTSDRRATLDHIVPLMRRGADSEANTVAACAACNSAKAEMTAQAFRLSAFLRARKAYAATVHAPVKLTVTVRRPRRPRVPLNRLES
ncbi:MAG: HNH endonuclease [Alphaproteobacteria bacterium]|nr:HNH endonuclease [Alphaproteobacteria bacterium]